MTDTYCIIGVCPATLPVGLPYPVISCAVFVRLISIRIVKLIVKLIIPELFLSLFPLGIDGNITCHRCGCNKFCTATIRCRVPAQEGIIFAGWCCRQRAYCRSSGHDLLLRVRLCITAIFIKGDSDFLRNLLCNVPDILFCSFTLPIHIQSCRTSISQCELH